MSSKSLPSKIVTPTPERVSISKIDHTLEHLWAHFNQEISGGRLVMRACMSNLIIYCDNKYQAEAAGKDIVNIVETHPARILLLTGGGEPTQGNIEALVGIYYTALNEGLQVCAERIDVIANAQAVDRLPSVTRSHLIGDLPITLWWASRMPPPEAGELFFQLAQLANQIIYDNMGWSNPAKGIALMTRWVAAQQDIQIVHNLAWRRIAHWRKLIAQVLDPQAAPDALSSLSTIEIKHGPFAVAMTWLLVSWLASRLEWKAIDGKSVSETELVWHFQNNDQEIKVVAKRLPEGEPLIYQILFDWSQAGQPGCICFERLDSERVGIVEGMSTIPPRVFAAHVPIRAALVSAQLAQRNRDKIFEDALKAANAMTAVFS